MKTLTTIGMLLCYALITNQSAQAGDNQPGYFVSTLRVTVQPDSHKQVMIFSAGPHKSKPACSNADGGWALDLSTPEGQALMKQLLSAYTGHKAVVIQGSNDCSVMNDRETAQTITTL
ncbi:hypothetical protein [Aquirhabdus parva]|uniref:Uncharacterized protein n=1 Tax=Aquirhabdus parva TaxID=2283318 RepID=A0A345P2G5_9GAMM|nr:hypothetical protein [Aquirhabdus parva]AXI01468.1 hypothetical protein HYN46_00275 [Aquirhabdus parva]AXI01474.1 hypothetical protein HYN46_00305 [Aquirhabdus parva]